MIGILRFCSVSNRERISVSGYLVISSDRKPSALGLRSLQFSLCSFSSASSVRFVSLGSFIMFRFVLADKWIVRRNVQPESWYQRQIYFDSNYSMFERLSGRTLLIKLKAFLGSVIVNNSWNFVIFSFKYILFALEITNVFLLPRLLLAAYDSGDWSVDHWFCSSFFYINLTHKFTLAISYYGFIFPFLERCFWHYHIIIFQGSTFQAFPGIDICALV